MLQWFLHNTYVNDIKHMFTNMMNNWTHDIYICEIFLLTVTILLLFIHYYTYVSDTHKIKYVKWLWLCFDIYTCAQQHNIFGDSKVKHCCRYHEFYAKMIDIMLAEANSHQMYAEDTSLEDACLMVCCLITNPFVHTQLKLCFDEYLK